MVSVTPKGRPGNLPAAILKVRRRGSFAPNAAHIITRRPGLKPMVLKVGTLDDPSVFGGPQMAIYAIDKQAFHHIPDGLPTFERLPKR